MMKELGRKKHILAFVLALLCMMVMLFSACGEQGKNGKEASYTVTVKDALGNPYTADIMVRFLKDGQQIALQVVNEKGTVSRTMEKGDYTVELVFKAGMENNYRYDNTQVSLSAEKTDLEIVLSQLPGKDATSLNVGDKAYDAYTVSVGGTYLTLTAGVRNYFLFIPVQEGTYELTLIGSNAAIGYYGDPNFVQEVSAIAAVDNKLTLSVSPSMIGTGETGTSIWVIGIDGQEADTECILKIERVGNAQKTIADEPWHHYKATTPPKTYSLPQGAKIMEFDLTASTADYPLVFNQTDGFYHLKAENGPLVLVRLTKDSKYIASFKTIVEEAGVYKYFFDEKGNFVKKEGYTTCLSEYIECADKNSGVYPLTEDLKYIIQQNGDYCGWWKNGSPGYLFKDDAGNIIPGINSEIAWLLMCCYIGA